MKFSFGSRAQAYKSTHTIMMSACQLLLFVSWVILSTHVTCATAGVLCSDTNYSGVCVWQRKLSAVCRNARSITKIRIQTNGLSPRCASVPQGSFVELNVDFEVNFNPAVNVNSSNQNFTSVSALSQFMCSLTFSQSVLLSTVRQMLPLLQVYQLMVS